MADWMSKLFGGSGRAQRIAQIAAAQQQAAADAVRQQQQQQLIGEQQKQNQILAEQTAATLNAQKAAEETAAQAALTPADSEDLRQSSERKTRRLLSARGFASTMIRGGGLGDAPVATRQLLGA